MIGTDLEAALRNLAGERNSYISNKEHTCVHACEQSYMRMGSGLNSVMYKIRKWD